MQRIEDTAADVLEALRKCGLGDYSIKCIYPHKSISFPVQSFDPAFLPLRIIRTIRFRMSLGGTVSTLSLPAHLPLATDMYIRKLCMDSAVCILALTSLQTEAEFPSHLHVILQWRTEFVCFAKRSNKLK